MQLLPLCIQFYPTRLQETMMAWVFPYTGKKSSCLRRRGFLVLMGRHRIVFKLLILVSCVVSGYDEKVFFENCPAEGVYDSLKEQGM